MRARNTIAEAIRDLSPGLAEAIEEGLYPDAELADELRVRAHDFVAEPAFFKLLRAANALENLTSAQDVI